jgi:hypothetical protein
MNKRRLHHLWTKVRRIKPWYFLVLALVSAVICVFALRANNQHMVVLRNNVYQADKDGTDVKAPLQELQAYVTTHMNTDLNTGKSTVYPPIQLQHTYERLVQARAEQLKQQTSGDIYGQAQAHCEAQNSTDFSGRNRVPCIEQYVQSHTPQGTGALPAVSDALYKFSFATPRWSPDLAGWSMAAAIFFGLLFIITLVAGRLLRRYTR